MPKSDSLIDRLVEDLEPVRPLKAGQGLCYVAASAALSVALSAWFFGFLGGPMLRSADPVYLIGNGVFLVLGVASAVSVVMMSRPRVGAEYAGWVWAVVIAAVLPVVGLIVAHDRGVVMNEPAAIAHGIECVLLGNGLGAVVLVTLVWWLRRGAPTSPERAGLLTGIASGSLGMFAFSWACADNDIVHIGLWHSAAVAVSALLGRLVVPRFVRW